MAASCTPENQDIFACQFRFPWFTDYNDLQSLSPRLATARSCLEEMDTPAPGRISGYMGHEEGGSASASNNP